MVSCVDLTGTSAGVDAGALDASSAASLDVRLRSFARRERGADRAFVGADIHPIFAKSGQPPSRGWAGGQAVSRTSLSPLLLFPVGVSLAGQKYRYVCFKKAGGQGRMLKKSGRKKHWGIAAKQLFV